MYVAPITDPMILGLDFLMKHNFVIDLGKNEIRSKNNTIPISLVKENDSNEYQVRRVVMKTKTVIPPHTVVRTKVKLTGTADENTTFAINPNHRNPKIMIPNTLVKGEKEAWINLMNPTDNYQHFNKDKLIGIATEVEEILEDTEDTDTSNIEINEQTDNKKEDTDDDDILNTNDTPNIRRILTSKENLERLPDHLKDLFTRSAEHLTKEEQTELADTLIEFQDVFFKK